MSETPLTGETATVSLRELLGGSKDPDFTMVLPPDWERRSVDEAEQERVLGAMRARFVEAQRPDLYARMRQLVNESFQQMRKVSTLATFGPAENAPEAAFLPASLTATVQHAEPGENLDGFVRGAITNDGATPLLGDKRFLRVERETTQTLDGDRALVTTVAYLTPVPGSQRRRALLLTLVILRPEDVPADDPPMVQMKALFDLCVSTLTWVPAEAQ